MTLRQSLLVVRRWRSVIVAALLIGVVVGWLSAGGTPVTPTTFQATQTLIILPDADFAVLKRITPIATLGGVPSRVSARLGVERRVVQSHVFIETPPNKGLVLITGQSSNRDQAEALANVTAEELLVELGGPTAPLRTLEPAVPSELRRGDIQAPSSRPARALLLGAFGLVLGIGGAFAVERFDNRVRSKRAVEDVLSLPVVAEIPVIPRSDRRQILAATPSPVLEAYRGLRTAVERWRSGANPPDGHRIVVVTSPTGGEGTTTTVAHLAATLGEIGRSVMAISADLRHPQLHLYFDRPLEPGLSDVLRGAPDTRQLVDLNLTTTTRGVRFVASGAPVRNPSPLLDHIGEHLQEARLLSDFVLVDAPPLLTTSEAADLASYADGVLLVVRAGRTSIGNAARSAELLQRLGIPVLGAVLVGCDVLRVE